MITFEPQTLAGIKRLGF